MLNIQVPSLKSGKTLKSTIRQFRQKNVNTVHAIQPVLSHRFQSTVEKAQFKALRRGLSSIQKEKKIDFIIAQCSMPAGLWALEAKRQFGIPFGVIEHFTFLKKDINKEKNLMSVIYKGAGFVGVVFDNYKKMIFDEFSIEANSVMNVISDEFKYRLDPQKKYFKWLFIGYDVPKKGPGILAESWKLYHQKHLEDRLTVVGSGEFLELRDHPGVHFISSANREEMVELMSGHHALISTSRMETFGMAVAEMLASGRPVVVTPSGGPQQFVENDNGIITDSFDPEDVAGAMSEMKKTYSSYDGRQIHEDILKKFGPEAYISRIESLLTNHV